MKLIIALLIIIPVFSSHALDETKDTDKQARQIKMQKKEKKKGLGLGTKHCFMVNATREHLCDSRAEAWCNEHKGAKECRRFINSDVSK